MTDLYNLCKNLRALSPGYYKMDGSYVEIGLEAAELIERLSALVQSDAEDKPIGFRTWDVPNPYAEGPQSDASREIYDKIKGHAVTQSDAEPDARKKLEEATAYAEQLATSLAARWYPEVSQWRPLRGDLIGLLTQIDNMTTGAVRAHRRPK